MTRSSPANSLVIGSEDADVDDYDQYSFGAYIQSCSRERASSLRLTLERNHSILRQVPYLYKKHNVEERVGVILTSEPFSSATNTNFKVKYNMYRPNGSGTAYAVSSLVAAGGYPISKRAEDILLGEQMAFAQGQFLSDHQFRIKTDCILRSPIKLIASPRRIIASYITNTTDWHADYFFDLKKERLIRADIDELVEIAIQKEVADGESYLNQTIESCREKLAYTLPPSLTNTDISTLLSSTYQKF